MRIYIDDKAKCLNKIRTHGIKCNISYYRSTGTYSRRARSTGRAAGRKWSLLLLLLPMPLLIRGIRAEG